MPWNDPNEIVVAGTGQVYVADVGVALPPTSAASLAAGFEGLGYHTNDGVSTNLNPDILELEAWQSKYPVRRIRQKEDFQISFALQQWNEVNIPLAFGGGEVISDGGSGYRYNPPTPEDAIDERALIVDVADGTRKIRFVIERGTAVEGVESKFSREAQAELPITFKALAPADGDTAWYFVTNDAAAFATGS